jgi:hypothetical protein
MQKKSGIMKFQMGADIINRTLECEDNFSCLDDDKTCLCEATEMINNKLLFIKPVKNNSCNYMESFGYSYYCNCPTRNELYKLYRI